MTQFFLGIDPGASGAIVILSEDGGIYESLLMPDMSQLKDLGEWASDLKVFVTIEDVQPDRGWHIKSAWTFAKHIGVLHHIFPNALLVLPRVWQKALWNPSGEKNPKKRSLEAAKIYWPKMDWLASKRSRIPHDGLVDAALIARYGLTCYTHTKSISS